jgi:hypothetical protein
LRGVTVGFDARAISARREFEAKAAIIIRQRNGLAFDDQFSLRYGLTAEAFGGLSGDDAARLRDYY